MMETQTLQRHDDAISPCYVCEFSNYLVKTKTQAIIAALQQHTDGNATVCHYFLSISMKAIYVLYNEICATMVAVNRLQWF